MKVSKKKTSIVSNVISINSKPKEDLPPGRRLFGYLSERRCLRKTQPMKPGDLVRASSLGYECFRALALASKYDLIIEEHLHPGFVITMDIGHYFHKLYRNNYFGPSGEWAGAWECLHCGWDTDKAGMSIQPKLDKGRPSGVVCMMPRSCPSCGAPFVIEDGGADHYPYGVFKEWELSDPEIFLSGHPDGWSIKNPLLRRVVDLKSNSASSFPTRRSAESNHFLQVYSYEHLCNDKEGEVWYLNKSPWGEPSSFIRGFSVPFDREKFKKLVVKPIQNLQNSLAGGMLPDRSCHACDCPRAKDCQLVDHCFG